MLTLSAAYAISSSIVPSLPPCIWVCWAISAVMMLRSVIKLCMLLIYSCLLCIISSIWRAVACSCILQNSVGWNLLFTYFNLFARVYSYDLSSFYWEFGLYWPSSLSAIEFAYDELFLLSCAYFALYCAYLTTSANFSTRSLNLFVYWSIITLS